MRDWFSRPGPASSTQAAARSLPPGDGHGGSDGRVCVSGLSCLGVVLADELRGLGSAHVPGHLQDRRDVGVGDEVLPALAVPVEEHPDPVVLVWGRGRPSNPWTRAGLASRRPWWRTPDGRGGAHGGRPECAAPPASRRSPHPGGLSRREVEVLQLAARGLTTREIGDRLYISPKTADHHIQHVYSKIGVSTRAAAALWAIQHDVIR